MNRQTGIATLFAAIVLALTGVAATNAEPLGGLSTLKTSSRTDTISVPEMQCGMCENRIEKAVKKLKGVSAASADAEANRVIVTYNPKSVSLENIEKAIADAGYSAGGTATTEKAQSRLDACCRPDAHE